MLTRSIAIALATALSLPGTTSAASFAAGGGRGMLRSSNTFTQPQTAPEFRVPQKSTGQFLELLEGTGAGSNTVTIRAADSLSSNHTLLLGDSGLIWDGASVGSGAGGYVSVPTYSDSACTVGQYALASGYAYFCRAANTWDRVALTGWSNPSPSAPSFSAIAIAADGVSLTATLSASVTVGSGGSGGLALSCATAGTVAATYSSGSPGTAYAYTLGTTVNSGDTCTAAYTQPGNGLEATSGGADVASAGSMAVTNSSTQGGGGSSETIVPSAVAGGWTKYGSGTNLSTLTDSDDATYFSYSSTSTSLQMSMAAPVSSSSIVSVRFCARMGETGTNNPQPRLRLYNSSTTAYASFTPDPVVVSGETYVDYCSDAMTVNPMTSAAWTKSDITSLTWIVNTGTTGSMTLNCSKTWAVVNY